MSNMSTKLEDLPGGLEDQEEEQEEEQVQEVEYIPEQQPQKLEDVLKRQENKTNIQFEVSKKDQSQNLKQVKKMTFFEEVRSQINEENLLLFVVFSVFMMNKFNIYLTNIPGFNRLLSNEFSTVLAKSGLAVLTFVIIKRFVLNKISL